MLQQRKTGDFLDAVTKLAGSVSLDRLPSSVVVAGRRCLLDTVGVILGGMAEGSMQALAERMAAASPAPCSAILGTSLRAEAMWAAFAHGTAGVWHEFDGGHRFAGGHPAIYCVGAGLALAEREKVSGYRLLEAVIAGYELAARVGLGTSLRPGMDAHGSWPMVGAAATAGILMGYDFDTLRETINVCTSMNLAASAQAAREGATVRNAFAGFGAAIGIFAADLVKDGFTGERDGIATVFGGIAGSFFDADRALEAIGERWEIERGYHKRHACARSIHGALDALASLSEEHKINPKELERIEVDTYAMAATMNYISPENPLAARHSIPHALASYLLMKDTGIRAYDEKALQNPEIQALAKRITVRENYNMTLRTPLDRPTIIRLIFADGRILESSVALPDGEPDTSAMSDDDLKDKFMSLASALLGEGGASALMEKLWRIETVEEMEEITTLYKKDLE